jgi:hypothetical protein
MSGTAGAHRRGALIAAVAAAALTASAAQSAVALLAVTAALQAALVVSWVVGTGMPGRIGGLVLGAAAAAGADVAVSVSPHRELGPLVVVLGVAVPAMFVHQLCRGVVRVRTTESLADVALVVVAASAAPALLQLRHELDGAKLASGAAVAAGAALAIGHLVDMRWPRPRFDAGVPRGLFAVIAGALAGGVAGFWPLRDVAAFTALRAGYVAGAIGVVAGLLAVAAAFLTHHLTSVEAGRPARGRPPRPALFPLLHVVLPLAFVAPVAYLLCVAVPG